jgi:drug/metabolite transporter (DMT)-like permease
MIPAQPTNRRTFARSGYGIALSSGVAWGVSNVINGLALGLAPFAGASRWLVAPLVAAALYDGLRAVWQLVWVAGTRRWSDLAPLIRWRRGTWDALGAALAGGPLATSCFFLSITFAGVSYGVAVSATAPMFGALWGVLFLKDRLSRLGLAGLLLTVAGAVIVSYRPPEGASRHFYLGVLFALITALGWSFEGLFAKRAMRHLSPMAVNTMRQVGSFLAFVVVLLPAVGGLGLLAGAFREPSVLVLLAAAAIGSGGYLLYFTAVQRIGPGRAMPLNLTYVFWTAILGVLLLGEPPTWQMAAGAVAVVAGASLVVRGERVYAAVRVPAADCRAADVPAADHTAASPAGPADPDCQAARDAEVSAEADGMR